MPHLETVGLTKYYRCGPSVVRALEDITLSIGQGELVAIMGRSGSGKTTLLDLLGLLQTPTGGTIRLDGADVSSLGERERTRLRRREIGLVFQEYNLLPSLSAIENVMLPVTYDRAFDLASNLVRARHLLDLVGLGDRLHHRPRELSGGERQRVALARSLIMRPSLVLADEPTAAVDTQTGDSLLRLIRQLNAAESVTFVLVTHDPDVASVARRMIRLQDGRVLTDSAHTPSEAASQAAGNAGSATRVEVRAGILGRRPSSSVAGRREDEITLQ